MESVPIFDFLRLLLVLGSLIFLFLYRSDSVNRTGKLILSGFLFVTIVHIFSNIGELYFEISWMDALVDYVRILQPVLFGFFLFSYMRSVEISRLRESEKKVRELNRFRERIIQDANIWINVLDNDANVKVWNKAAEEISGYSEEEVVGHDQVWKWLYPDEEYGREIAEKVSNIFQGDEVESYETIIRCKDGKEKVISWASHPLEDDEGGVIGSVAIGRDITERKKSEERKDFLNTLLRQDLGSKCRTIRGYLQLLEEEVDVTDEQREYLEKAMKAGREADEILGLARKLPEIEETDWIGEKDIVKVLNQATDDISRVAEREGVKIEKTYPDTISKVEGDYSLSILFSQIVLTRIQTSECDTIKLDARERDEDVLVRIEDNGEQLPEDIASMFSGEPYTGETTGVGGVRYYIVRQIAEHNNAEIDVKDSDLGGAKFDVKLRKGGGGSEE
ncbi:MAG: PAS domain S-box protein [Candidatus Hadarchaeota archaeon]